MKKQILKQFTILMAATFLLSPDFAGGSSIKTLQGNDTDSLQLKSITVEGWEVKSWSAVPSPAQGIDDVKPKAVNGGFVAENPQSKVESKLIDKCIPKNLSFKSKQTKCQGLRFKFAFPGTNYVVIEPTQDRDVPTGFLDDNNKPRMKKIRGLELPGRVEYVSVWVLGRGNEYNLEGWIEDWQGNTHIYQFGSLDFIGWRPLTIRIPNNVPQDVASFPQTKNLTFKKFIIRAQKEASLEEVVLFFDHLKILTDIYDLYFDGADIDFDAEDKKKKSRMKEHVRKTQEYAKDN